tara:strand:- start:231 stop:4754 length:4524 start_codon:yes stop_codon:yes gene_type:complete
MSFFGLFQQRDEKPHAAGDASPDSVFAIKVSEITPNLLSSDRDAGNRDVPYQMQQTGEESGNGKGPGAHSEPRAAEADRAAMSPDRLRRRWVSTRKEMKGATELVEAKLDLVESYFDQIAAIFDIVAGESGLLTAPLVHGLLTEMLPSVTMPPEVPGPRSDGPPLTLAQFIALLVWVASAGKPQRRPELGLSAIPPKSPTKRPGSPTPKRPGSPTPKRRATSAPIEPGSPAKEAANDSPKPKDAVTDALRQFSENQEARLREAIKTWQMLKSDAGVVAFIEKETLVLERAFVLGCTDRPATEYHPWNGPVAQVEGLRMRLGQFAKHASCGDGENEGPALLTTPLRDHAQPVVVHLPTPCVLHKGEVTADACPWLRDAAGRASPSLLLAQLPLLYMCAVVECATTRSGITTLTRKDPTSTPAPASPVRSGSPTKAAEDDKSFDLSFAAYVCCVVTCSAIKYGGGGGAQMDPTDKVAAGLANLLALRDEEETILAWCAGKFPLPDPPDATAAARIQARLRGKRQRKQFVHEVGCMLLVQLKLRNKLMRIRARAEVMRRKSLQIGHLQAKMEEEARQALEEAQAARAAQGLERMASRKAKAQRPGGAGGSALEFAASLTGLSGQSDPLKKAPGARDVAAAAGGKKKSRRRSVSSDADTEKMRELAGAAGERSGDTPPAMPAGPTFGGVTSGVQPGCWGDISSAAGGSGAATSGSGSAAAAAKQPKEKEGAQSGKEKKQRRENVAGEKTSSEKVKLKKVKKGAKTAALLVAAMEDPRHLLFTGMTEESRQSACECMFEVKVKRGTDVIKQGDKGDNVYIVESGRYEVFLEQFGGGTKAVHAYQQPGDSFGELAVMYSCARAATIRCAEPGKLWGLDRSSYKEICRQQGSADDVASLLSACKPLSHCNRQAIAKLSDNLQIVKCASGNTLIRPGVPLDSMYIVQSGGMKLTPSAAFADEAVTAAAANAASDGKVVADAGELLAPRDLKVGDCFGEEALGGSDKKLASSKVVATEDTVLARVTRDNFFRHVGDLDDIDRKHFNWSSLGACGALMALWDYHPTVQQHIAVLMSLKEYEDGDVIAEQGRVLKMIHVVHSGEVEQRAATGSGWFGGSQGDQAPTNLEPLTAGAVFGERALISPKDAATTTLVARGKTVCMVVGADPVQKQVGPLPPLFKNAEQRRARRAKSATISLDSLKREKILGVGTFGAVYLSLDPETGEAYALKCIRKHKVFEMGQCEHIISECKLLNECEHPFIVRLVRAFEDTGSLYLMLELTLGGELFSVLADEGSFPERRSCFYSSMTVAAFEYLHERNIIYRDLRPENLLIDAEGYLKVVDFGFAKRIDGKTFTVCGTPDYMAPEIILNKGHGKAVDWWTAGILLFEMLTGFPPFEGNGAIDLYKKIVHAQVVYPGSVPPHGKDVIGRLLTRNPDTRIGQKSEDVKAHPFYKKIVWQSLLDKKIVAPFKPTIKDIYDTSNFEECEDPDAGVAVSLEALPPDVFEEFSALVRTQENIK